MGKKIDFDQWRSSFAIPLASEQREMMSFPSSVFYPPLLYLPQTLGIWAGRLSGFGALGILYAARLGNILSYCLVFCLAIRLMPIHQWVMAMVALIPMSIFMAASVSADGVAISYCALFTATIFAAALGKGHGKHFCWWVVPLSFGMGVSKPYIPLLFLTFLLPSARVGSRGRYIFWVMSVFGACAAAVMFWQATVQHLLVPTESGLSSITERIQDLWKYPFACVLAVVNTWIGPGFAAGILHQLVGVLGWLDTPLPPIYVVIYLVWLLLASVIDRGPEGAEFEVWQRIIAGAVFFFGLVYVSVWLYVSYTPVNYPLVRGIQGRYLLPLLMPALSILWLRKRPDRRLLLAIGYAVMGVATAIVTTRTLFSRYY